MADRRRVDQFPHNIVGDQRLPFGSIIDERFNVSLQEVRGDCGHVIDCLVGDRFQVRKYEWKRPNEFKLSRA